MYKMKQKIFLLVIVIFLVQTISALTVNINIPPSFSTGQQTYFDYTISSGVSQEITFTPHINCPNAPIAFLQEKIITINTNEPYNDIYNDIIVTENIEPQTCIAYVQILNPVQQTFSKEFQITTNPSFSFDIKLDKKVFLQNQDIYLDYSSSVTDPSITATLTYPDKTTESVDLPTTINGSQIGTYELEVTASKEGYKTANVKEQFGVIEKSAEIEEVEVPDLEKFIVKDVAEDLGESVEGEISGNSEEVTRKKQPVNQIHFFLIVGILVALMVVVIIFLLKSKKNKIVVKTKKK